MTSIEEPRESAADVEDPRASDGTLREVSKAMVKLYKEQFGRGPETVWTRYSGPDAIMTMLANTLTPVECTMRDMGEEQRLRDIRMMFQHATESQFRELVERITGRKVIGFMSGIDVQNDLSCEVFTLEPQSDGEADGAASR